MGTGGARRPFTERLARASARRPWLTLAVWGVVVACALAVTVTQLDNLSATDEFTNRPESERAQELIDEHIPGAASDTEIVLVRSSQATVDDAAMQAVVQDLRHDIVALGTRDVVWVVTYYDLVNAGETEATDTLVSDDRRTTIMSVSLTMDGRPPLEHVAPVYDLVQAARSDLAGQGFTIAMTGNATWEKEAQSLAGSDLTRGEIIGIPIALVVLLFVFGALVAAGVPFVLALAAILITLAVISVLAGAFSISVFAANVVVTMGLAVGIDYALFVLSRFREERAAGATVVDAVGHSGATASLAVFFSGLTVVLALLGMLIAPFSISISMGVGMILVVLFSVLAALTLLPALLAVLGDRVNALRMPLRRSKAVPVTGGRWARAVRTLMRHPALTLLVGAGLLIALSVPGFGLVRGNTGPGDLPARTLTRQGYEMLQQDFAAGLTSPVMIALDGDQNDPEVQAAVERLTAAATSDGRFQAAGYETASEGAFGLLKLALVRGDSADLDSTQAVADLRETIVPAAVSGAPLTALVGGGPAVFADILAAVDYMTPIVFAIVLSLSFVLLLLAFRSLVIALIAIVMNLLSVGAAYGLLTLVFQHGIGAGLLGLQQTPEITSWVPMLLFCVLFGLSMDYQVFLLSRIREYYDLTGDTREAVVFGVSSTAGIITGAALIMVAVFAGMASGELVIFQQIGFGLGTAIFLDAAVVRTLVVPAVMTLLGRRNWYLPRWLEWLPRATPRSLPR